MAVASALNAISPSARRSIEQSLAVHDARQLFCPLWLWMLTLLLVTPRQGKSESSRSLAACGGSGGYGAAGAAGKAGDAGTGGTAGAGACACRPRANAGLRGSRGVSARAPGPVEVG